LIPKLLDRAEALLPKLLARLEELGTPEARQAAGLLRSPPPRLYITAYPKTPVVGERYGEALKVSGVTLGEVAVLRRGEEPELTFIVLFPALQDAPDPELSFVLAHELLHAAGRRDEEGPRALAEGLARRFPSDFRDPFRSGYVERFLASAGKAELVVEPEYTAMPPSVLLSELSHYARPLRPVRPPAPPAPPPAFRPELHEKELREHAVSVAVKVGLAREEAERLVGELWGDLMEACRAAKALEEAKAIIARLVEPEARRRLAPPPPPPPPAPPPVAKVPEELARWLERLPSGEKSYLLTFGAAEFISRHGGKYTFTLYDQPLLASALATYMVERARALRPTRGLDYFVSYLLPQVAPWAPLEGLYTAIRRVWDIALASLRRYFTEAGLPDPWHITIVERRRVKKEVRQYEHSFGRVWMDAVVYAMYRALGVEEGDIPRDLRRAHELLELWRRAGMPAAAYVEREEAEEWLS
jgi:hypothetical protein